MRSFGAAYFLNCAVTTRSTLNLDVVNGSRSASFLTTNNHRFPMITNIKSALASTACALPLVLSALTTYGLAQGSTQTAPGGSQSVAQPTSLGKYTPDADQYGSASGQIANPTSYVQMFGFPMRGETIELQLRDARPNTAAVFYVSTDHADQDVPNFGRVLVDVNNADTYTASVDVQGCASIAITIPNNTPFGSESYVQCVTYDAAQVPELSKAVYFEVGQVPHVTMMGTVDGSMSVTSQYGTGAHGVSGVYNYEWHPATNGNVDGFLSIVTEASLSVPTGFIQDLTVQSNGEGTGIVWGSSDFLQIPNGIADEFWVSYTHQGIEYGPYIVSALTTADATDIDTQLSALPTGDGGPLDGATISLDLTKSCLQPAHFDELDSLGTSGLTSGGSGGAGSLTGQDVEANFDRAEYLMNRAILSIVGNLGFFHPEMPTYAEFVAREAVHLLALTGGQASTVQELTTLSGGELTASDDENLFIAKLLAALHIEGEVEKIKEALLETVGDDWKKFKKHADNGKWKKAGKALKKMLKKLVGKEFTKKLTAKIGKKAAAKLVAKLGSKCVPFLGWGLFVGGLLWAYVEQIWD